VVPDQFPNQARTHSDVLAIEWLLGLATDQIQYAALLPFCRVAVFQVVVTLPTLTSHSSQNAYSQHRTVTIRLVAALGLRTSNLYHHSHCHYDSSEFTASADAVEHPTSLDWPRDHRSL